NIVVKNESLTEQTVTITYTADSLVTITDVNGGTSYTINGNTASITITIDPLETDYAYVYYTTPSIPLVALGDQLTFTAAITAIPNDAVAANNEAVCIKTIVGSFDPNSKSESHGDEILFSAFAQDETLNYTINFENSGTANAINVKLTDVLDAQLDETSVRLVGSTHAVQMSRMGNNLEFNFPNILLPPAEQGTMIGQGSVQFTVKMKPGFAVGDIVPNFASIIFDTNPAIVTNLVETEFVSQLGVSTFGSDVLRIYPNPASETMTVSGSTIDTVEIVDVTGKVVLKSSIGASEANIDVSGLARGVYVAKILSAGAIKKLRFIKQ
ncbi:MAG: T9SS type A sorting domain-containing protein, partial [Chitinophagaceae bacterium]